MPSIYIPRPPSARTLRIDNGLAELCDLQLAQPLSQEQIGDYCGVTKQAIGKIEKRARRKLERGLKAIGIERNRFADPDYSAAMKAF